ncbi:MAG: NAD-dependent epimerase/dehydratase family protein [Pseudomonadota bacterium]
MADEKPKLQPELQIDNTKPVMVTGATGYVAGWLVKRLLEAGVTVHAPVRSPGDKRKVGYLEDMAHAAPGELKLFQADLLEDGSYTEAMAGCTTVFHTASPFTSNIADPQRDLVDPAVKGTRNVLNSVNDTPSVERVVLTSSCAAIFGDNSDVSRAPGGKLTEDVWNTSSSLEHNAYAFSKTEAEKAAWEIAKAQDRWKMVVINPSLVLGPAVGGKPTSESFSLMKGFGDGKMKAGAPPYEIGMVDVRDVADAHIRAAFVPSAEGRHITSARTVSFLELGQMLRDGIDGNYPFPTRTLPAWLLSVVGPIMDKNITRRFVRENMNKRWRADNTKIKRELGVEFSPVADAAVDMFQQLVSEGEIKAR